MKAKRLLELKNIVARSYELTAQQFNATRSKIAAPDFQRVASQISPDDKVFDAGCGNGRLLNYISLSPANYFGLDQSQNLLSLAKANHPEYHFEAGDLSELNNLKEASFSVIFCSAVLSHIPGKQQRRDILQSFYHLGSPGAKLIISFWKMEGKYRRQLRRNWWKKLSGRYQYGWRDLIFPWKDQSGQELSARYYYYYSSRRFKKDILTAGWKIKDSYNDRFNYWVIAVKD